VLTRLLTPALDHHGPDRTGPAGGGADRKVVQYDNRWGLEAPVRPPGGSAARLSRLAH